MSKLMKATVIIGGLSILLVSLSYSNGKVSAQEITDSQSSVTVTPNSQGIYVRELHVFLFPPRSVV